jgi:cytochrome c553
LISAESEFPRERHRGELRAIAGFTGMPAWPAPQRDDEVWAVVAFLKQLPQLDKASYQKLVGGDTDVTAAIEELSGPPGVPLAVVQNCVRCHGIDGVGRGTGAFPKLAGQRRNYLENALKAYATGERHSGTMGPISAGLKADAIPKVARYYSQLAHSDAPLTRQTKLPSSVEEPSPNMGFRSSACHRAWIVTPPKANATILTIPRLKANTPITLSSSLNFSRKVTVAAQTTRT